MAVQSPTLEIPTRQLELSNGLFTLLDEDWAAMLCRIPWHGVQASNGSWYAVGWSLSPGRRREYMHRTILGALPDVNVDHRNGDSLDNRRANLRLCTQGENVRNRRCTGSGASRYKGVARDRWKTGRRSARIRVDGRRIWLGTFATEEEAARAYNEAAVLHHGEFAQLNVVLEAG